MNCSWRRAGERRVDRPVEDDDAAVRRQRIAGERLLVGIVRRLGDRDPARVVVLDDHARRPVELVQQPSRRVEVEHVVERQRPAVLLRDPREDVGARPGLDVERRLLVRVLAVGELEELVVRHHPVARVGLVAGPEPARDRGVVGGGVGERLVREPVPGLGRDLAARLAQLLEHRVVALRPDDDGDPVVVLGRGADHRRAADVDVLDRLRLADARLGDRALERIEVDADEVDRLDPLGGERRHVLGRRRGGRAAPRAGAGGASSRGRRGSPRTR